MEHPAGLEHFLGAVAKAEPPLSEFWARCVVAPSAPRFSYTLPLGEVVLFPDSFAFLTLDGRRPGATLLWEDFARSLAREYASILKYSQWVEDPSQLLLELGRWLTRDLHEKDNVAAALSNANSIFLPVSEVLDVTFVKGIVALRPHHIIITTASRNVIVYQDPQTENQFKTLSGQFSGRWQPEFLEALRTMATRNRTSGTDA
jgi:hypothetical protein